MEAWGLWQQDAIDAAINDLEVTIRRNLILMMSFDEKLKAIARAHRAVGETFGLRSEEHSTTPPMRCAGRPPRLPRVVGHAGAPWRHPAPSGRRH
jgi:hypothetical protein